MDRKASCKHRVLVPLGLPVSMIQVPVLRNHFRDSSCGHCPGRTPSCRHTVAVMANILSIRMDSPVDKQVLGDNRVAHTKQSWSSSPARLNLILYGQPGRKFVLNISSGITNKNICWKGNQVLGRRWRHSLILPSPPASSGDFRVVFVNTNVIFVIIVEQIEQTIKYN